MNTDQYGQDVKADISGVSESGLAFNGLQRSTLEKIDRITEKVIGCAYTVSNTLGCGFLEKIYENAMAHELRKAGMNVQQQYPINVLYDDVVAGEYVADLLVEETVIVELKAVKEFDDIHMAQCMNYLKATGLPMCLLINFGKPHVDIKRIINHR